MSSERLMLLIGRPVLSGQWHRGNFYTRNITWQERLRNAYQVHTYPVPPIFDVQEAQQLLTSADYTELYLYVSLLELDYHQCTTIVDGLSTLFVNLPSQEDIYFHLEYERGNPEHRDAVQQARVVLPLRFGCYLLESQNVQIEATSDMAVKGDGGPPTEDDSPDEDD